MNGAGKKVWGYYPTTDTWIPLQVDANGKVVVDMSGISLGDLGDTWLPAPGDQYFLYWDDAAGKWDCRILVDADIPASIARDAEVAAAIAAHHDSIIKDADGDTSWDVEEAADEDKVHGKVAGVEAFLLDTVGNLTLAQQTSAKAYRHGTQSIPNATWTTVLHNTKSWDIHGDFDIVTNHRFDVAVDGLYLIIAQDTIYAMPADSMLITRILVNASDAASGRMITSYQENIMSLAITMAFLTAGEYVWSQVYQTSGGAKNIATYDLSDYLIVAKIA